MQRFLNWFSRTLRARPATPPRRPFRPRLEPLGDRVVPSTVSSAISIYHPLGRFSFTEMDWFTIDQSTHQVVEFSGTTRTNLGGPSNVWFVAASVDPATGWGDVFALAHSGNPAGLQLWLCDSSGTWHNFGGAYGGYLSATRDGHVFVLQNVSPFDTVYMDSQGNAIDLGKPPGSAWAGHFAASVSGGGVNEVFATHNDGGALYVCQVNQPGVWQLVDNSQNFVVLSATPDNTVFATTTGGSLYQEYLGEYWNGHNMVPIWLGVDISGGRHWSGMISADRDASGQDEVYAVEQGTNNLYLYDQGHWTMKDSYVQDVSGADGGYFYDVNNYAGILYAYLYNPNAQPGWWWTYLGSGLS
jgi:hypothetical protein